MKVQNGLYDLDIFIDGLNLFQAPRTIFISGDIYESIMNPLPTCKLEVIIPLDWLDSRTISDGTIITYQIKSERLNIDERTQFRVFNINEISLDQQFAKLKIDGVLDTYFGYIAGNHSNIFGNSSDVFKSIATKHTLSSDIDATNDSQLWIAGQKNVFQYLIDVAAHGWIDDTSAMIWCLDRKKTLLYKNLTSLFRNRQHNIYNFIQKPIQVCKDKEYEYGIIKASIQSGSNNLKNDGYGGEEYYFDLNTYTLKSVAAKKTVAESKFINIDKELSQGLMDSQFAFDVGNFHPNYYLALKQNKRILATYSSYIELQCQHLQNFRLGQIVNYQFLDSQSLKDSSVALSGTGIIDAIRTKISKEYITANVEIVSQGMNGSVITREVY